MPAKKTNPWLRRLFWPFAVVVVVVVVLAFNLLTKSARDNDAELLKELNARYTENIDFTYNNIANNGEERVIVIDGVSRYDCSEADARLTCSDDPQPTLTR